jgi:hypothetical protein
MKGWDKQQFGARCVNTRNKTWWYVNARARGRSTSDRTLATSLMRLVCRLTNCAACSQRCKMLVRKGCNASFIFFKTIIEDVCKAMRSRTDSSADLVSERALWRRGTVDLHWSEALVTVTMVDEIWARCFWRLATRCKEVKNEKLHAARRCCRWFTCSSAASVFEITPSTRTMSALMRAILSLRHAASLIVSASSHLIEVWNWSREV